MAKEEITIDVNELQKFLSNITQNLDRVAERVIEDLSEFTLNEMQKNYSSSEYEEGTYMDFNKKGSNNDKTVSMEGPQAWYSEFGTGTRGEATPHPMKNKFSLNAYNSGPTIRPATDVVEKKSGIPTGTLYWTYKGEDGKIHYTQGIPSQKIVYNSAQKMFKEIPKSIKKNLGGMFK